MKLIILLIALGLEKFVGVGAMLGRTKWFDGYLSMEKNLLGETGLWKDMTGTALVVAPLPVVVFLVYWLLGGLFMGLLGVLIALAVLLFCLGPEDVFKQAEGFITASEGNDAEAAKQNAEKLLGSAPSSDEKQLSRDMTVAMFEKFNSGVFAVIFWFIVLGPFGAVLYRVSSFLSNVASKEGSEYASFKESAMMLMDVLNWVPVRIFGLCAALVGNFSKSFTYWFEHVIDGLKESRDLVKNYGLIALDASTDNPAGAGLEENKAALGMLDRSLIVFLAVVVLFTLGAWIY